MKKMLQPQEICVIKNLKRFKLRPWLISLLDSKNMPGVEWTDKQQGVFKLPWQHAGKSDYKEDLAQVQKAWAIQTGKYSEGVDEANPSKWKTNLRNALHQAQDITQLSHAESQKHPFRIYKFKKIQTEMEEKTCYAAESSMQNAISSQTQKTLPQSKIASSSSCAGYSFKDCQPQKINRSTIDGKSKNIVNASGIISGVFHNTFNHGPPLPKFECQFLPHEPRNIFLSHQRYKQFKNETTFHHDCYPNLVKGDEMYIELIYRGNIVMEWHVTSQRECNLFFNNKQIPTDFTSIHYGENYKNRFLLQMPHWPAGISNPVASEKANDVLDRSNRGIVLECANGDINIMRMCQSKVYTSSERNPTISRDGGKHTIFSYQEDFEPALGSYKTNQIKKKPKPSAVLYLGQQGEGLDAEEILVMVRVTSCLALHKLQWVVENDNRDPSIHFSDPDSHELFLQDLNLN